MNPTVAQVLQDFVVWKEEQRPFAQIANDLKNNYNYDILTEALPQIFDKNNTIERAVWGNLFPETILELGVPYNNEYLPKSVSNEMFWVMLQVSKYKEKITKFILYRDQIIKHILLGEYERAICLLNECKIIIGLSVWYFEYLFLIYCLSGKERLVYDILGEINHISEVLKKDGKHVLVPYLLHFLFLRSSESKSINFDSELKSFTKRNRETNRKEILNYFELRLNYYSALDKVEVLSPLFYEAPNALVDRYRTLYSVLLSIFLKNKDKRIDVTIFANQLYNITKDSQLLPIIAYNTNQVLPDLYYEDSFTNNINLYYSKQYDNVLEVCKSYVNINPCSLNNIRLYIQALINDHKDYAPICPEKNSLLNSIAENIYLILSDQNSKKSLVALENINKRLFGLPISAALHSFIGEQKSNTKRPLQAYVLCTSFDPIYSKIWETAHEKDFKDFALLYLNNSISHNLDGIAVRYYQSLLLNEPAPEGIATYRIKRDQAINYFKQKEYSKCLIACQSLLDSYPESISIGQVATEYMFMSYYATCQYMEAISFYVNTYVNKKSLVNKVKLNDFLKDLRNNRYKGLINNIDLQIFILLNAEDYEQKAYLLEMFMNYHEIINASGLINKVKNISDQRKVEIFLTQLVTTDVMKYLTFDINSTLKLLEEKHTIAEHLLSLDSNYHEYYEKICNDLSNNIKIHKSKKDLNEGKIFVDKDYLINKELLVYEKLYNQLLETGKIVDSLGIINVLSLEDKSYNSRNSSIIEKAIHTTNNAFADAAIHLFDAICNKYLYGKLGLRTFLSTRIRHGVLLGELRSAFDNNHLILYTAGMKYLPTDYWEKEYRLEKEEQNLLMSILSEFSNNLFFTTDSFKENVVSIRTNENGKGMFDFRVSDDSKCTSIFLALRNADTYQEFCQNFIKVLERITDSSLNKIRLYIYEVFRDQVNDQINSLQQNISNHFKGKHFYTDLNKAVNQARLDFMNSLAKIEKWFFFQTEELEDFNLSLLMKLLWDGTSIQYPNIHLDINFNIKDADLTFKARYFYFISDILTILYNNIYSHGRTRRNDKVSVSAIRYDEDLLLRFQNITEENDIDLMRKVIEGIQYSDFQEEGLSGLAKVRNILRNELFGNLADFNVTVNEKSFVVSLILHLNNLIVKK